MKAIKKNFLPLMICLTLVFSMSPTATYAKTQPHPVCAHGNIGCSSGTTMYCMNRVTTGYDKYMKKYYEKHWYKCFVCGYETAVTIYV